MRLEILRRAAAAFRDFGYHSASMEDIARALHMTKGNLYHYFNNKEEILFFCHDYFMDRLLKLLRNVERGEQPPQVKLRQVISGFVQVTVDQTGLSFEVKMISGPRRRRILRKRDIFERGIRRIIQSGMETGVFRPGDPKLRAFAILGSLNWISMWFDSLGEHEPVEISEAFVDCFMAGLLTDPVRRQSDRSDRSKRAIRAAVARNGKNPRGQP